jgi:inosose dehydratase
MTSSMTRRNLVRMMGVGLSAVSPLFSATKLKIGHTGITWGNDIELAIKDVSNLGFYGFETFGNVLEAWETHGGLAKVLEEHKLPLISAYCSCNLIDPSKRKEELEKMARRASLIKKCGGGVSVIGPNSVKREGYDFKANKANIIASLNETAKMLADMGVVPALHQHTGTCIETRDEVYAVLDAVDSRYLKFGPDVGQLAKGGSDPVQVVKDYLPLVRHLHLKDYSGGEAFLGYCPLGQGKVKLPAILEMLEKANSQLTVMVELDPSQGMPMTALETAQISKKYLQNLGYTFRTT